MFGERCGVVTSILNPLEERSLNTILTSVRLSSLHFHSVARAALFVTSNTTSVRLHSIEAVCCNIFSTGLFSAILSWHVHEGGRILLVRRECGDNVILWSWLVSGISTTTCSHGATCFSYTAIQAQVPFPLHYSHNCKLGSFCASTRRALDYERQNMIGKFHDDPTLIQKRRTKCPVRFAHSASDMCDSTRPRSLARKKAVAKISPSFLGLNRMWCLCPRRDPWNFRVNCLDDPSMHLHPGKTPPIRTHYYGTVLGLSALATFMKSNSVLLKERAKSIIISHQSVQLQSFTGERANIDKKERDLRSWWLERSQLSKFDAESQLVQLGHKTWVGHWADDIFSMPTPENCPGTYLNQDCARVNAKFGLVFFAEKQISQVSSSRYLLRAESIQ